jgi:hypothetical protein
MPKTDVALPGDAIARLQHAIRQLNHCESKYVGSVTVSESFLSFQDKKLWQGDVAIFDIFDHPEAERAYAWSYMANKNTKYVVVLEIPPIDSPETAVQAAIAAQIVNGTFIN